MSYTPGILIDRKSLELKTEELYKIFLDLTNHNVKVILDYLLYKISDDDIVKFDCIELIIIQPELSSDNKKIRDILYHLDINYRVADI